jgi:hypothetical protein
MLTQQIILEKRKMEEKNTTLPIRLGAIKAKTAKQSVSVPVVMHQLNL